MCGIVGIFSRENPIKEESIKKAVNILYHRGPDAQKYWISKNKKIALGHARLSIIDLTTGDQPIANENEKLRIVVNGELYGFEKIRKELEEKGHRFRTGSDSEIPLHLYEEYGTQLFQHLRGEFAFILHDEANHLLMAARDRFGIKPLYYTLYKNTLYLASEIKSLLALGAPAEWDEEAFFQAHHLWGVPLQDRTWFKNIYQVPPGHYLIATQNHLQFVKYWDFNYPLQDQTDTFSETDYIRQFREKIEEAVKLRLRADVPVGCYLSGGLDSCAVLGIASQHQKPIEAFTLCFDRAEYDEGPIAKEMAELAHANYHPIIISQKDLTDHFSDAIWHCETITFNYHIVAKFLLSRAVRDAGIKVVLTGEGSDEILAGYPHFRRDMLLYNHHGQDSAVVQKLLSELQSGNQVSSGILLPHGQSTSLEGIKRNLNFIPSCLETASTIASKFYPLFSDNFSSQFLQRDPYHLFLSSLNVQDKMAGRDPVNQSLYLWSKLILPNYILNALGDRIEMAHSVEGRLPFLDHHVVESAQKLPISLKIKGMTEKYILREAAKPFLTETVYKRQKHPFLAPPISLSGEQKSLQNLMQDTLRGKTLETIPFYNQKKVISVLDDLPRMDAVARTAIDFPLMNILSVCILKERFKLS